MSVAAAFFWALLAGMGFALLGLAYRVAQVRKLDPQQMLFVCCLLGAAFFAAGIDPTHPLRPGDLASLPPRVWLWSLSAGVSQYLSLFLVAYALKTGPFSPVWCAISLYFVPVAVYAAVFQADPIGPVQYLSLLAACGAVVASAGLSKPAQPGDRPPTRPLIYAVLLLSILVINGLANIALKELAVYPAAGPGSFLEVYRRPYLVIFYLSLAACVLIDVVARGQWKRHWPLSTVMGALAASGSVIGIFALSKASSFAMAFTISSATGLLGALLISVLLFRERVSRRWVLTVALTLAAILFAYKPKPPPDAAQASVSLHAE